MERIKQLPLFEHLEPKLNKLLWALPEFSLRRFRKLPAGVQTSVLSQIFNKIMQPLIADDELEFLRNRQLEIVVADLDYRFYLTLEGQNLVVAAHFEAKPDVTFSGEMEALMSLVLRTQDPDTLFFQRQLLVTGDTEMGLELKNMLDDFDLEQLPVPVKQLMTFYTKLAGNIST